MTIAATTATNPLSGAASLSANQSTTTLSSDFETFLRMLSVQMQNQDPLNPIDSSEYAMQLATFSSVEQQVFSNDLLTQISAQMGILGLSGLAGWVGMEARITGPAEFSGEAIEVVPWVDRLADEADLIVLDEDGQEVQRYAIGVTAEPLSWSGIGDDGEPLPDGLYSFQVENRANGQVLGTYPADVYTEIHEARNGQFGTTLVGAGGIEFLSSSVISLRAGS